MWLALIDEVARSFFTEDSFSLEDELSLYQEASEVINKMWQDFGQHAFLHHLNAIFGYISTIVQGKYIAAF